MAELSANTLTHDDATKIMETVVNRWFEAGQSLDTLLDVIVSVAVDLNVRAIGERRAASYFRAVADQIHPEDGGQGYDA
jgi:hypothetical protein